MDAIPPTAAALMQHTKRAVYQGGHVWGQAHVRNPELPSPDTCGWRKSATKGWEPLFLPEAAASCSELLRCGCLHWIRHVIEHIKDSLFIVFIIYVTHS